MSSVTVGRAGALGEAGVISVSLGKTIRVTGDIYVDGATDATDVAERFAAYVDNPDESVVPVIWSDGPSRWDGFYRVLSVELMSSREELWSLELELERVQGFAAPIMEAVINGGKRVTAAAGLTAQAWHALPQSAVGYELGPDLTPTTTVRQCEDGDLNVYTNATNTLFNARPSWSTAPADYYDGAPKLTVGGRLVVGRQADNQPVDWEMSNGVIMAYGVSGSGEIRMRRWTGSAWAAYQPWQLLRYGGASEVFIPAPRSLTVIRNGPEEVGIRLTYDASSMVVGSKFRVTLDLTMRRGAYYMGVYMETRGSYQWGLRTPIPVVASTSVTECLHSTNGSEACLHGLVRFTGAEGQNYEDSTRIPFSLTGYTSASWGWGFTGGNPTLAGQQWGAAQSERVQAVAP